MAVELLKSEGEWALTLGGSVDIFDAVALHAVACEAANDAPGLVAVRLHDVTAFDTAAAQILLALHLALAARGHVMRVEGVPAAVEESWRRLAVDVAHA